MANESGNHPTHPNAGRNVLPCFEIVPRLVSKANPGTAEMVCSPGALSRPTGPNISPRPPHPAKTTPPMQVAALFAGHPLHGAPAAVPGPAYAVPLRGPSLLATRRVLVTERPRRSQLLPCYRAPHRYWQQTRVIHTTPEATATHTLIVCKSCGAPCSPP